MKRRATIISVMFTACILIFQFCTSQKSENATKKESIQKKVQNVLEKSKSAPEEPKDSLHSVHAIKGLDELNNIVENTPGKLLVFDLYTDWCMPCKILAPLYDSLSRDHSENASFFRVDVQRHQDVAYAFRVQSIPLIIFIRDKEIVHSVSGLNTRDYYERILSNCGNTVSVKECKEKLKEIL